MITRPQENTFEEGLILQLSAEGQSAAYELFTREALSTLLRLWLSDGLPDRIRTIHGPPASEANAILRAALIAKLTYLLPDNPLLTAHQRRHLYGIACAALGYPPDRHTREEIQQAVTAYPILARWLQQLQTD